MPTTLTLDDKMKKLSAARRKKIENRAAQLIAQEMSLRNLWKARSLTQEPSLKSSRLARAEFPAWKNVKW